MRTSRRRGTGRSARARPVRRPAGRLVVLVVLALLAACGAPGGSAGAGASVPAVIGGPAAGSPAAPPTTAPPARGRLVIHGTGDVNLDPAYIPALAARGWGSAWTGLDGLFTGDDLTIVNLECPVSDAGAPVEKEFTFRCAAAALPAARAAGVDVANLANNHGGDRGPDALLDSVRQLRAAGIAPVGVGADVREATTPAIVTRNGWRIAVLGFGGVVPAADWLAGRSRPGMASGDDIVAMTAAVRAARGQADLVFVTVHWGVELDTRPRPDDVARAHTLIDAGAAGIFGHHAHRLQPLDTYRGRPIAWGLGNFVWPNMSEAGSRSAVAEVVVEPDGTVRGCLLPVRITAPGHPELVGARSCP